MAQLPNGGLARPAQVDAAQEEGAAVRVDEGERGRVDVGGRGGEAGRWGCGWDWGHGLNWFGCVEC